MFQSFSTLENANLNQNKHNSSKVNTNYFEPETFLEIEVVNPRIHETTNDKFTDYEVNCNTNLPNFRSSTTQVRRRYSDFETLRKCLINEMLLLNHTKVKIPNLPGKIIWSNRFDPQIIEERRLGLNKWLKFVAGHPLLQSSSNVLVRFIENTQFTG